jgi:hypothetical protein
MIAITTNSSISVNPGLPGEGLCILLMLHSFRTVPINNPAKTGAVGRFLKMPSTV